MSELLDIVLRAHGGLDGWSTFENAILCGGGLLPMKGIKIDPTNGSQPRRSIACWRAERSLTARR